MIFYIATDENGQRQLRGTQADAKAVNKNFEQVDIPTDKTGLMAYIQDLFTKIDGSAPVEAPEVEPSDGEAELPAEPAVRTPPVQPSYTEWSVKIEDAWDKLPLAHQLHFAAIAMENARSLVSPLNKEEPVHPGG